MAAAQSPRKGSRRSTRGAIKPTGTWSVGTRAGDFVYVAGMRGIDPKTNTLVEGDEARIRQGFLNMKLIAESEGASLRDAVRIVVYVTDMAAFAAAGEQGAGGAVGARGPIRRAPSSRCDRLNQDDIFEVEGTFYAPVKK